MSKASKTSLSYLLRQLALAKQSSSSSSAGNSSGAAATGLENAAGTLLAQHHHHHYHGPYSAGATFSTSSRSHSLEVGGVAAPSDPAAAAVLAAGGSSTTAGQQRRKAASHQHRGKASHHYQHHQRHGAGPHVGSTVSSASTPATSSASTSSSLLPSFWTQPASSSSTFITPLPFASSSSSSSTSASASSASATYGALNAPSAATSTAASAPSTSSNSHSQDSDYSSHLIRTADDAPQESKLSHSNLTLHHGAYGIPKRARPNKGKERELDPADSTQAQIAQLHEALLSVQVGEDAYFVRDDSLGVADGVGGWSGRKGADPGLFAARLMHHCSAEIELCQRLAQEHGNDASLQNGKEASGGDTANEKGKKLAFVSAASANASDKPSADYETSRAFSSSSAQADGETAATSDKTLESGIHANKPDVAAAKRTRELLASATAAGDPIEILHRAWDLTLTEFYDFELIGSSTALIALLKDDELRLANIGDCCCSIIRDKDYIFRLQEQQHSFNYPFQMGTNSQDTPRKDGQLFNIKVQKDDIVILSSDGLVDNLFDEDILEEVLRHGSSPEGLSKALCSRAKAVSEDQRAVTSPFQQRANEEGIHFVGGKHDDISVLVAVIGDERTAGNAHY